MKQAKMNIQFLKDPLTIKKIANILTTNVRACSALNHPFISQLGRIYLDMLNVYKVYSEEISNIIAQQGTSTRDHSLSFSFIIFQLIPNCLIVLFFFSHNQVLLQHALIS
jgi:hypothetical protein